MNQITQKSVAKYLTFMALVGILLFGVRGLTAYASEVASGNCGADGANVTWTLDEDGKLTISGTGEMADYDVFFDYGTHDTDYSKASPWSKDHREKVETVEITDGVTEIGWINDGTLWYYTDANGDMQTGWINDGDTWYYLDASGAMQTGWLSDGGSWYYLGTNGAMRIGWYSVGGKYYYSYASGKLAVSTKIGSYRVNANGEWIR
ncbi:MAG: N-acetylmuramoyl-L-alanine amidase family protein [Lachnospiraceae bacterium]|nr:N-acetylmuramoyl-L-alanine amidase family protein [Lachnospiraceae bacterium]